MDGSSDGNNVGSIVGNIRLEGIIDGYKAVIVLGYFVETSIGAIVSTVNNDGSSDGSNVGSIVGKDVYALGVMDGMEDTSKFG